jgi:hypothetical protein
MKKLSIQSPKTLLQTVNQQRFNCLKAIHKNGLEGKKYHIITAIDTDNVVTIIKNQQ